MPASSPDYQQLATDNVNYSIVHFVPAGAGYAVALEFPSGFKLRHGIEPDVNEARCSPVEFAKLGTRPDQTGSLLWYFKNDPAVGTPAPDLTIANVNLVDAAPAEIGATATNATIGPVSWRLWFTDFRDGCICPRGGILRYGMVNPSDPYTVTNPDGEATPSEPTPPLTCSQLITMCLTSMNLPTTALTAAASTQADLFDPPRDLQWHGSHAPTELGRLLERCNLAFCPHVDGTASIEALGSGSAPSFAGMTVASQIDLPAIDRRGATVVFTSAPSPIILTSTISGLSSSAWEWVVQDSNNIWQPIAAADILTGYTPATLIQTDYQAIVTANSGTPPTWLHRLKEQLYRCLRLNTSAYPPKRSPILKRVYEKVPGLAGDQSPQLMPTPLTAHLANVAYLTTTPGGVASWSNRAADIEVESIIDGNVLKLAWWGPVGKLASGGTQPLKDFTALGSTDLAIRVSMEESYDGAPLYWQAGFTRANDGTVSQLASGDAEAAVSAPGRNVTIYHCPAWRDAEIDGTSACNADLAAKAKALAGNLLNAGSSAAVAQEVTLVGYAAVNPAAQIDEVTWHQMQCSTMVHVQSWYRPRGGYLSNKKNGAIHAMPAHPQQDQQAGQRQQAGAGGQTDSTHVMRTPPAPQLTSPLPAMFPVKLTQTGGSAGSNTTVCTFTYTVKDLNGATLATAVALSTSRFVTDQYTAATNGMAYWGAGNALILVWCDEVAAQCSS